MPQADMTQPPLALNTHWGETDTRSVAEGNKACIGNQGEGVDIFYTTMREGELL
jgi:hypothetical protein